MKHIRSAENLNEQPVAYPIPVTVLIALAAVLSTCLGFLLGYWSV